MAAPELKITKQRIRNHFHYFWWQYMILLIAAVFGWNLIYTTTRYQSPEHLKVEWYYEGITTTETDRLTNAFLEKVTPELFPEMEEVMFTLVGMDDQYGQMQMMVWSVAGQGDLYMLMEDSYLSMIGNGVMCDLLPWVEDGTLNIEGINVEDYYMVDQETGKQILVGIPTDSLKGLLDLHVDPEGKVMGMLVNGGNVDNTVKLMAYLLDNMK